MLNVILLSQQPTGVPLHTTTTETVTGAGIGIGIWEEHAGYHPTVGNTATIAKGVEAGLSGGCGSDNGDDGVGVYGSDMITEATGCVEEIVDNELMMVMVNSGEAPECCAVCGQLEPPDLAIAASSTGGDNEELQVNSLFSLNP
ncbi:unnamed protein product [Protopolystoma xenopodis]|uniref:Uncharacterized protein n=1 Tax=Protopolystoma xenopodis TaxID=117903 RepID=A0A3S4ZZE5_9PLAT|nr:unnamed protein product [Protopolystoma xenopodis]